MPSMQNNVPPVIDQGKVLRNIQYIFEMYPDIQNAISQAFAQAAKQAVANDMFQPENQGDVDSLREVGCLFLSEYFKKNKIDEVKAYFNNKLTFPTHNPGHAKEGPYPVETLRHLPSASYSYLDVIRAPHLLELALDPNLLGIVSSYLGCPPVISELNVVWSHPADKLAKYGQSFHRDTNDFKWISMFVYLTDSDVDSGAHQFIKGTHDFKTYDRMVLEAVKDPETRQVLQDCGVDVGKLPRSAYDFRYNRLDKFYEKAFENERMVLSGPAGSIILEDTRGLHFGTPPRTGARLVYWVLYGLYNNRAYASGNMQKLNPAEFANRMTVDDKLRYSTQLMFDWS